MADFTKQWSTNNATRAQLALQPVNSNQNMLILEHDLVGSDYCANFKAMNPSPSHGTGIFVGGYLQSITKNLAVGVETIFQRMSPEIGSITPSYLLKYTSANKDWIATAQFQGAGVLQATYWQKLAEKVEFAADLQMLVDPMRRDAIATLGAKYDLRMSTVRAQVDSTGKVSALLDQKLAPTFSLMFSGEIDHFKNSAKVGVGFMIETISLTPEQMGYTFGPPP